MKVKHENQLHNLNQEPKILAGEVIVTFTGPEFHDLQVIAHIPEDHMRDALSKSGGSYGLYTYDVYTLLKAIKEAK